MIELFSGLDAIQLVTLVIGAILIGINKTALPGLGLLPVVMLASTFNARLSTGLQLGMLALADVIAVLYYRRHADWKLLARLLPWAFAGLALGAVALHLVPESDDQLMRRLLGIAVLMLVAGGMIRDRLEPDKIPSGLLFSAFFGIMLGFFTQFANAAGPVAAIYFLAMRLDKEKYMGCSSWFFLIVNWTKVPIFVWEGRITAESACMSLAMLPLLLLGGIAGILLLRRIPRRGFEAAIRFLVVAAAIKLLI